MENLKIKKKFLENVKDHEVTIICDNGEIKSIIVKNPKDYIHNFTITSWKDHLCISGDMGTYVFNRENTDMFSFFRTEIGQELSINPDYWHEKLVADSCYKPSQEYSDELLVECLYEELEYYCEDNDLCENAKQSIKYHIKDYFFRVKDWDQAIYLIKTKDWVEYKDSEELDAFAECLADDCEISQQDVNSHSYWYIWCLYAIVWTINQYDKKTSTA